MYKEWESEASLFPMLHRRKEVRRGQARWQISREISFKTEAKFPEYNIVAKRSTAFVGAQYMCIYIPIRELEIAVMGCFEDWKSRTVINSSINNTLLATGQFLHSINHHCYVYEAIILYH